MKWTLSSRWFGPSFVVLVLALAPAAVAQEVVGAGTKGIELADRVHLLAVLDCNVIAVVGPDGVLMIDTGSASDSEILDTLIAELDTGPVRIALNSHYHFDHVGGNEALAENGAIIVAHENLRPRMQADWSFPDSLGVRMRAVPPYREGALPQLTFAGALTVHFGGYEIEALHLPSAHTDADLVFYLRDANVLHTGDLYLSNGFPPGADVYHGGTIDGAIAAVEALVELIDDDTKVVPGHGPVSNRQELREYGQMLAAGRDRVAGLIAEGKTLEEAAAASPTAGLYTRGESWIPLSWFVRFVYAELVWFRAPAGATGG